MKAMKERWFNYRPICLVFLFLLLGSLFSFYVTLKPIISIAVLIICAILFFILAFWRKSLKLILIPLVAFLIGSTAYNFAIINYNANPIEATPEVVQARVYLLEKPNDDYLKLTADNLIIDGKEVNSNIIIYVYDNEGLYENFEIGRVISFKPNTFYHNDLFYYETPNSNLHSSNIKYTAAVEIDYINFLEVDRTFAEQIKQEIKENLGNGLTNENVEIAYSALFGEKEMLSDKQYSAMKLSGVAHLMAVSGLHVGIIVTVLLAVFKLCKVKKWWKFAIMAVILTVYAYICNFSVSVVRASVMALILILADILGREYDSLNSISIAGIICFLVNPFVAFDVGFLLSFSCVLGITIFYKTINKALTKWKMSNSVTTSIAISVSTMISLLFIMAYFFQNFNIISIVANSILIPIFTVVYIIIFIVSFISLIIPFLSYALYPLNYLLNMISFIAGFSGNLPLANLLTIELNYITIFLYFALIFILGRICVAKNRNKVAVTLPIVALIVYLLVI